MIIKIRGKEYVFSDAIEPSERNTKIKNMLKDNIIFDDVKMTVEEYFRITWNKKPTIVALDKIGNYLSKMPNQNGKHDKEILSKNDELEITKGVRHKTVKGKREIVDSRYINFSELSKKDSVNLGLLDVDDSNFN
ncbi:hypothetical protein [Siminovitchia sp. 179-K 8D1 HS]|uniref:hypothetical protein n=1 Tax=Siminovitchia sp. 179-K 8D1 HS TaxID=3142385 RepID=UPI0039A188FA